MRKTVWKLAPYECFEVDAIAGWLDEMSQMGLQFQAKWGPFCRFERSPAPARYRVDPRRDEDDPTERERTATYRDFGWEFCSYYTKHAEVYRAEDPNAPELHTDCDLLDGLVKRTIRNRLIQMLALALYARLILQETVGAFKSWANQQYDSDWLPLLLFGVLTLLIFLVIIVLSFTAALRYKYHSETIIHTPQRAKRGTLWRRLLVILAILCIAAWVWAIGIVIASTTHT